MRNVKAYNRAHARTLQEGISEGGESHRAIWYYMFLALAWSALDADTCVTQSAVSDPTPFHVKAYAGLGGLNSPKQKANVFVKPQKSKPAMAGRIHDRQEMVLEGKIGRTYTIFDF